MVPRPIRLVFVAALLAILVSLRGDAAPEPRFALVIGIDDYGPDIGRLRNPVNDARLLATTLERVGFKVQRLENVTRRQLRDAATAFGNRLKAGGPSAVGLFYFAGHGLQVNGRNWLVPKGAVVNSEADIEDETVRADYVLDQMDLARNQLNIVILDACRNNPFGRSLRSAGRGLAPVQASSNTVVGYATAPNDVAQDGTGANSPYATALSAEIGGGSDPIEITLRKVTARVKQATGNRQSPFVSTNLDREFRFRAAPAPGPSAQRPAAPAGGGTAPAPQPSPGVSAEEQELEAWKSLGTDPSKAELEAFLKAFPNGKYAGLARAKIKTIEERERAQARPAVPAPSTTAPAETRPAPAQAAGPGKDCAECPEMVTVPAGSFVMGSPAGEEGRDDDEGPQRTVTIGRAFAVGKFEVTFAEWDACVAGGGCNGYRPEDRGWGRGNRPVIYVNWNDAQAYVQWLSNRTGKRYRLLSEAEWEYVARAGTTTPFSFGNTITPAQARFASDRTAAVGSFPANRFGLHDMHGNVWEWTEDCYNGSYAGAPSDGSAWRSGDCSRPVLRGGSWYNYPRYLRSAGRDGNDPSHRVNYVGFRVARTL